MNKSNIVFAILLLVFLSSYYSYPAIGLIISIVYLIYIIKIIIKREEIIRSGFIVNISRLITTIIVILILINKIKR